jgi:hypothetical protein
MLYVTDTPKDVGTLGQKGLEAAGGALQRLFGGSKKP